MPETNHQTGLAPKPGREIISPKTAITKITSVSVNKKPGYEALKGFRKYKAAAINPAVVPKIPAAAGPTASPVKRSRPIWLYLTALMLAWPKTFKIGARNNG